jgi:MFS transporter, OFA family, oxalate/formate antiporter
MGFDPRRVLAARIYYGWVIVAASLLATTAVYGTSYAFGVFYDAFVAEFEVSRSVVAGVFGLQTAVLYLVAVGAGQAVDRHGQRAVVAVSSVLFVGGLVWTAFARSALELFVAFGVLSAVGMGGLFVVSFATIPLWFGAHRGAASGLASAGLGIGLVVFPVVAEALIADAGWRRAMLAIAVVSGGLCLVVTVLFADRPDAVGTDTGREFEPGRSPFDQRADDAEDTDPSSRETIASAPYLLVFLGWVLLSAPIYVVVTHVVSYAAAAGIGRSQGVLALTAVGVTATVARFGVGALSDRLGRTRTFVACTTILGAAMVAIALAPTPAAFLAAVVCFGVGYGGCGSLFSPLVADLFGHENLNTLFAVMTLAFGVAALTAPPLAGRWFEVAGSYTGSFLAAGIGALVGAGCIALASRAAGER